ncbi:MAG: YggS family pyridoxal phosphate-dependent enzyme [Pseudomonadota bacterium]
MIRVTENLNQVRKRLQNAARVAGREPSDIKLLAVSKRHSVASIEAVAEAGQQDFGENFVAEGLGKIEALAARKLCWHFIGAIQSNKTRDIAAHYDWVHTVDRLKIARRLSEQRPEDRPPLELCLQVNVDDEPQKAGVRPAEVAELAEQVARLPGLRLRGLMCLPRVRSDPEAQREPFAALRQLLEALQAQHAALDTLSMGMTGDLEAAVLEGATIVRVGTAIFGPRD